MRTFLSQTNRWGRARILPIYFYVSAISFLAIVVMGLSSCTRKSEPEELALDGDFRSWTAGHYKTPDYWLFGGDGRGEVSKDISAGKNGQDTIRIENTEGVVALYQDLPAESLNGRDYVLCAWVKASKANSVTLSIDDGVAPKYSRANLAANQWELHTLTGRISDRATKLRLHINVHEMTNATVDSVSFKVRNP